MASVLLIRPLCEGDEIEFAEPLGIERLAGYLRLHGIDDVRLFDRRLHMRERQEGEGGQHGFYAMLSAEFSQGPQPDIVGVSLMTSADVADARRIITRLRSWWPQACFAAGGLYVTTCPHGARRALPQGTVLLQGEGEFQLLELVRSVAKGSHARGAADCGHPGGAHYPRPDEWAPAYRPYLERYARLGCAVNMQTSHGCPGTCAFCATPQLPQDLRRWEPRSLRLVVREMACEAERLNARGLPPVFNFVDDDFGSLERVEQLAEMLGQARIDAAFMLEMRTASLIGEKRLAARLAGLRTAGLTRVFCGVESLNMQTLVGWGKPYDVKCLPQIVEAFRSCGVTFQPGYILWHAAQTVAGALCEAEQLQSLGIYNHRVGFSRLIVFDGCTLARGGTYSDGFQQMNPDAEAFHRLFVQESADITRIWTKAAVAEPYAAAVAHLTGDEGRLREIRTALEVANRQSYELLMRLAASTRRCR